MKLKRIDKCTLHQAFARIEKGLDGTGWSTQHVHEAREIIGFLDDSTDPSRLSEVARSRAEILKENRYFEYWYFEGAPLSVQIALEIALETGAFVPAADHVPKCAEFRAFFSEQLAFKRALNWSETVGGWIFPGEPENIWKMVKRHSGTEHAIAEIGSWTGRSTILLASAREQFCPGKPLHIIDDWAFGGQPDLYPYLSDARKLRAEFEDNTKHIASLTIHETTFQEFAPTASDLKTKFDLVFHDAGHTRQDFERDLPLLETILAPSATLLIHDYMSRHFGDARSLIDAWIQADGNRTLEATVGCTAVIRIGDE